MLINNRARILMTHNHDRLKGTYVQEREQLDIFLTAGGKSEIADFAVEVQKVGKNMKIVNRVLILTRDTIYKLDEKYV